MIRKTNLLFFLKFFSSVPFYLGVMITRMYVAEFIKPLNEAETTPIFHSSTRTRVYVYTNSYTSRGFVHMVIATQLNSVRFISYVQMRCVHRTKTHKLCLMCYVYRVRVYALVYALNFATNMHMRVYVRLKIDVHTCKLHIRCYMR